MSDWGAMHADLFDLEGVDGTVRRGVAAPVPVRVVLVEGQRVLGEFGQTVGQVRVAYFLVAQFRAQQGDVLTAPSGTRTVASVLSDDGFVVEAVLHG